MLVLMALMCPVVDININIREDFRLITGHFILMPIMASLNISQRKKYVYAHIDLPTSA